MSGRSRGSLYVKPLGDSVREVDLREKFSPFGELKDVYRPMHHGSGRPSNYCYIEFLEPADADKAIAGIDGTEFHGMRLTVEWARGERKSAGDMLRRGGRGPPPRDGPPRGYDDRRGGDGGGYGDARGGYGGGYGAPSGGYDRGHDRGGYGRGYGGRGGYDRRDAPPAAYGRGYDRRDAPPAAYGRSYDRRDDRGYDRRDDRGADRRDDRGYDRREAPSAVPGGYDRGMPDYSRGAGPSRHSAPRDEEGGGGGYRRSGSRDGGASRGHGGSAERGAPDYGSGAAPRDPAPGATGADAGGYAAAPAAAPEAAAPAAAGAE